MKKCRLFPVLFLILAACGREGDPGPRGPEGPQGPEGIPGEIGYLFEFEDIDFTAPDYELFLNLPQDFGYETDVALVYFEWEDVWRQLPQVVMIPEKGILQYNFDFTKDDIRLFLDADFPLDDLAAIDTDDWYVRVVIVPGTWGDDARVDLSDYNQVKEALGLPDLEDSGEMIKRREIY